MSKPENPVSGEVARTLLGQPGPPIGRTRYSAIRKAMGLTGRYVSVRQIQDWIKEHPDFQERDIYKRKLIPLGNRRGALGEVLGAPANVNAVNGG